MVAGKTIALVAGEASGDLLGSHLIAAIREQRPEIRFVGIGGPKMQAAGMEVWFPLEKLAVRGYVEVLRHYREIVAIRTALRQRLLAAPPDLFIGIDAPDFNLDLELALKRRGIPTVHYVSPSIWAWRGERIHKIKRAVSQMLALFPFEPALYQQVGLPCSYVGHPLADMLPLHPDRAAMRRELNLPPEALIFALLPGSRQSEVRALADTFVATAVQIAERHPEARFLVPLISPETRALFEAALARSRPVPLSLLSGQAHQAMIAADGVLVASGTATLEAALLKRPMVITYKVPRLTYWLSKRRAYQPWIGLPNILAGRFVVPEILQDDATPEHLAQALLNLVANRQAVAQLEAEFTRQHQLLRQGTAQRAAEAILPYLA